MKKYPEFTPTNTFGKISFDNNNCLWKGEQLPVFRYEEINDFEVIEEREERVITTINEKTKTKKGGVGRAIIGGAAFGPVGALVGASTGKKKSITKGTNNTSSTEYFTKLGIKFMLNDMQNPSVTVNYISCSTPVASSQKTVNEIDGVIGFLNIILSQNSDKNNDSNFQTTQKSAADEIVKFKQLFDDGIITEEEFETKKSQLLGM